jgi:thiol-disulfide isomerase/thioredoxin
MKSSTRAVVSLCLVVYLFALGCKAASDQAPAGAATVSVGGIDGIDSLLSSHQGRWVLVNLWATWCVPCVAETPDLIALHSSLPAERFALLGISMDNVVAATIEEASQKVSQFGARQGLPYHNLVYNGTLDDIIARFDLPGPIPVSILYNPSGTEHERWVGQLAADDLGRIRSMDGSF